MCHSMKHKKEFSVLIFILFQVLCFRVSAQNQLTNIPTIYIDTYEGVSITSKDNYVYAQFTMVDGIDTLRVDSLRIRGRGNASWSRMNGKKPYRLKFPTKQKLLGKGFANSKNWVLLAQADDKSFLRNALTWEMTRRIGMPYSPGYKFVDLYLNGNYRGNYLLCDHIDIRKKRVNIHEQEFRVEDDTTDISGGYLLEVDGYTDEGNTYFQTSHEVNVRVHSPEPEVINDRQISYIQDVVQCFEDVLYSKTPENYKLLVDSASFIGWYVAGEITANIDAYWSVYFYKDILDPLLYWGPLWDEDLAYNNTTRLGDVTESLMADVGHGRRFAGKWIDQLKEGTTWFWTDVYNYYKVHYDTGLTDFMTQTIDSLADMLRPSAAKNFEVWDIEEKVFEEFELFNTYDEYVKTLRQFVTLHNDYLLKEFALRAGITPPDTSLDTTLYYRLHIHGNPSFVLGIEESEETNNPATACLRTAEEARKDQQWRPIANESGWTFINRETGLALADYNLSEPYSYALVMYPVSDKDERQMWTLTEGTYEGYYNLVNVSTGRIIDNRRAQYKDGNSVISYTTSSTDEKTSNRLWSFEPVGSVNDDIATALRNATVADYALRYAPRERRLRFIAADRSQLDFKVSIYDLSGKLICSFTAQDGCNLPLIPTGTYIASWNFGGTPHSIRFHVF